MTSDTVQIQMLGSFVIERNGQQIDDQSNRMRKVWLLLAYLIYHRNSHLTQSNYTSLLSTKGDEPADPGSNLKAMFYRARTMLNQIDGSAGHDLIVRRDGTYCWNTDVPLRLDVEEFEQLCRDGTTAADDDARLNALLQAIALYKGDFLPKLSMESWVLPISTYYHRIYLEAVESALIILEQREQWADAAAICEAALKIEPYSEALYQQLMRSKLAMGDRAAVPELYETMSELLFSTFGVMPSDESRALYREATRSTDSTSIPAGTVRDQLREPGGAKGALFCEYDFFKLLYQAQARALIRSGDTVHIGLFSVHGQRGKEIARRSLDHAMENIKEVFLSSLRQGDVVTQCSVSQLIIMLPQANYENSCAVCQRLIKAYFRQYPHAPVDISFSVQPLEPMGSSAGR